MKKIRDLISIVVPIYNSEKKLGNALNSLLKQTYKNLEIILIDDGSSDNSLNICYDFKNKDNRICVFHTKNRGVSSARNLGISVANGKYIYFMDSDDIADINLINELYKNILKYHTDLSICGYNVLNKNHKISISNEDITDYFKENTDFHKYFKYFEGYLWNKLFLTKKVKELKFDTDIAYCEDLLFIIEYLEKCNSFSYTHLCLYNYYIYENSASNFKKWNKKNITVAKARKKIINILNKYDFSVYKDYYLHYFYCLNEIYHKYDDGAKYKKDVDNSYSFIMSNNYSLITKCKVFFKRYCFSVFCLLKLFFKE